MSGKTKCLVPSNVQWELLMGHIESMEKNTIGEVFNHIVDVFHREYGSDLSYLDWADSVPENMSEIISELRPDDAMDVEAAKVMFDTARAEKFPQVRIGDDPAVDMTAMTFREEFDSLVATKGFDSIVRGALKHFPREIHNLKRKFQRDFYEGILVDFKSGTMTNFLDGDVLNERIDQFKEQLSERVQVASDMVGDPANFTPEQIKDLLKNPTHMGAYFDMTIAANFDLMVQRYFGDVIKKDGKNYAVNQSSQISKGWEGQSDYMDGFSGLADINKLNLTVTPTLQYNEETREFTEIKSYTTELELKKSIHRHGLSVLRNNRGAVAARLKAVMATDPVAAGIYARFFAPEPVTVIGLDGPELLYSYEAISQRALNTPNQTGAATAARNMVVNMTYTISNTFHYKYVTVQQDGLKHSGQNSPTFSQLEYDIDESMTPTKLAGLSMGPEFAYVENTALPWIKKDGRILWDDSVQQKDLTVQEVTRLLKAVGVNMGNYNVKGVIEYLYNKPSGKQTLMNIIVGNAAVLSAGTLKLSDENVKKFFMESYGISEMVFLKTVYEEDRVTRKKKYNPADVNRTALSELVEALEMVNGFARTDSHLNAEGKMNPTYGMGNGMMNLPGRITELQEMGDNTLLKDNYFIGSLETPLKFKIEEFWIKDGYRDSQGELMPFQKMLDPDVLFEYDFVGLYLQNIIKHPNQIAMDFVVPADKTRYTVPVIDMGRRAIPVSNNGKLDTEMLIKEYLDTVGKSYIQRAGDVVKEWNTVIPTIIADAPTFFTINDLYIWVEQNANLLKGKIEGTVLKNNLDYVKGPNGISIRPDILEYYNIYKSEGTARKHIDYKLREFMKESPTPILPPNVEEKFKSLRIGNEKDSMDALLTSYFFNYNILYNQLIALHQGNVFQYKPAPAMFMLGNAEPNTDERYKLLSAAVSAPYIDLVKRAVASASTYHKPVLQSIDSTTGLVEKGDSDLLPQDSYIAYFKDVKKIMGRMLNDGRSQTQEVYDGGFFNSPLEVAKTINSYGGNLSGMESKIIKDFTVDFDGRRGISSTQKKASFQATRELMRMSKNNRKVDFHKLFKIMLESVPFIPMVSTTPTIPGNMGFMRITDPLLIQGDVAGIIAESKGKIELDENGKLAVVVHLTNGREIKPKNMFEVYQEILKDRGTTYDNVEEGVFVEVVQELLMVENLNPQIANQYIAKIGFDTSVKSGLSSVNPDIVDVIQGRALNPVTGLPHTIIYVPVSNANTGIQLNPDHDPGKLQENLTMPTQKLYGLAFEGHHADEVSYIYEAVGKLSSYKLDTEIYDAPDTLDIKAKTKMIRNAELGDPLIEALIDKDWVLSDPSIYKRFFTMMSSIVDRAAVRHKFAGGQFVLTPVNGIYMLYRTAHPVTGKDMILNRVQYERFMKEFFPGQDPDEGPNAIEPTDLKWTDYINKISGQSIYDSAVWTRLKKSWEAKEKLKNGTRPEVEQYVPTGAEPLFVHNGIHGKASKWQREAGDFRQELLDKGITTTVDAVEKGMRTGTSRTSVGSVAVGDIVNVGSSDKAIYARVTKLYDKPLKQLLADGEMTPESWSEREGWTPDYLKKNPAVLNKFPMDFALLESGENQTPEPVMEETINVYWGKAESKDSTKTLSNLAERRFTFEGREYGSVEHAYQTLKSGNFDQGTYDKYNEVGGYGKKIRGAFPANSTFDNLQLMKELVVDSFRQNPESEATQKLLRYKNFTHPTDEVIDRAFLEGLKLAQNELLTTRKVEPFPITPKEVAEAVHEYKTRLAEYRAETTNGNWEGIPGEVLLPSVFKSYFSTQEDITRGIYPDIDLNDVRNNEDYFLPLVMRRSPKLSPKFAAKRAEVLRTSFLNLMEGVISRTPGSGPQSSNVFRVVGYMDSLSNAVGIPVESMIVKGEDFDVDKGYVEFNEPLKFKKGRVLSEYSGMVIPYFTIDAEGKMHMNTFNGRVATRAEIEAMSGAMYNLLEKQDLENDWYAASIRNYIVDGSKFVLSSALNLEASNSPVTTETMAKVANEKLEGQEDTLFSHDSPMSRIKSSVANKVGTQMIGITAVAAKGYSALYQSARMRLLGRDNRTVANLQDLLESEDVTYTDDNERPCVPGI
jgi:hypothetical protein